MEGKELFQKLHEAADLLQKAKDAGIGAEVHIVMMNGGEKIRLNVTESVTGPQYYVNGYYMPEGGDDGKH